MKDGGDKRLDQASGLQGIRELMSNIAGGEARSRAEADPIFMRILNDVVRTADDAPWREVRDGVSIREIWDDRTYLLRCAAGSQVPCHVHDREELLILLDGEMRIGEAHLSTGDIELSLAGSEHPVAEALEDCLALVQYSR